MKKPLPALALDVVLVVVFCAIGRRSHDEGVLTGLFHTLWPFLTGLLIGWLVASSAGKRAEDAAFSAAAMWPTGVVVWLGALVGGMVLRVVGGQGVAFSFVIVAASVLAVFLIGWRGLYRAVRR